MSDVLDLSAPIDVYSDWVDACEGVESVQRKPSRTMAAVDGYESLDEL
jgi:transcription elongation factor Elf1